MSTTISSFPFIADKITDLPAVTSLAGSDKIVVNASGVTSTITKTLLIPDLDFQPHTTTLDTYSSITSSPLGQNLLALANPTGSSYIKSSSAGAASLIAVGSVLADIAAQPRSTNLDEFATVNPSIPGKNILRLDAPAITGYVRVSSGIDSDVFIRTPSQVVTDIGAMPASYLVIASQISGGTRMDDAHVPSTLAMQTYVSARLGSGISGTSDDTIASASTLNLDSTDGAQIDLIGTTPPTSITLSEKDQKIIVFKGIMTITPNASIITPGSLPITTSVDSFATFIGGAAGVVTITNFFPSTGFAIHYGGDFFTNGQFTTLGSVTLTPSFSITGNKTNLVTIGTTGAGSSPTTLNLPAGERTLEVSNYWPVAQTPAATVKTYILGAKITVPSSKIRSGSTFSWKFNMTKTAAGSASSTIDICVGTAGDATDTARISFTKPAGTAAVDEGFVTIEAVVKANGASGLMAAQFNMVHNLASTGHMTIPGASVHVNSSAFDMTVDNLMIGLCITTGASDAITIEQVTAKAFNI